MCDWDDFEDFDSERDFDEDAYMDEFSESLEDPEDLEIESQAEESDFDRFNAGDAFIIGGAMGWAYEEGSEERRRRRSLRKMGKRNRNED